MKNLKILCTVLFMGIVLFSCEKEENIAIDENNEISQEESLQGKQFHSGELWVKDDTNPRFTCGHWRNRNNIYKKWRTYSYDQKSIRNAKAIISDNSCIVNL